jgi:hypothetical protein
VPEMNLSLTDINIKGKPGKVKLLIEFYR